MLIIVAFAMFILVLTRKLGGNNNEHTEAWRDRWWPKKCKRNS
jgi:hypothetical protein